MMLDGTKKERKNPMSGIKRKEGRRRCLLFSNVSSVVLCVKFKIRLLLLLLLLVVISELVVQLHECIGKRVFGYWGSSPSTQSALSAGSLPGVEPASVAPPNGEQLKEQQQCNSPTTHTTTPAPQRQERADIGRDLANDQHN